MTCWKSGLNFFVTKFFFISKTFTIKETILPSKFLKTFFVFLLYQNWFKNKNKSSLGAKEAQENNFEWYAMDFVPKTYFEKKSCQICSKLQKFLIFLTFQSWSSGRKWPMAGWKSAGRCSLNFFVSKFFFIFQNQKFTILI